MLIGGIRGNYVDSHINAFNYRIPTYHSEYTLV